MNMYDIIANIFKCLRYGIKVHEYDYFQYEGFSPNMVAVALQFINLGAFPNENIILDDFLLELHVGLLSLKNMG